MQRLANYELLHRLGSGGMAEVWMARMLAGDRITKAVALKLLTAPRVEDERYRRMFVEEARLSMLLGHSNIVQVFDAGSQKGVAYLAMEWVDGLTLDQLTSLAQERRLPFPNALAAHVIGEILQALAYAHTVTLDGEPLGLIHRDVSPQNVLISVSGEVKLADFGIARLAHEETSGLFLKGKLRYMPPEQICGVSNAPTVDLYAVGAIFHELLDGVRFRGDDDPTIYAQIQKCRIPELRRRNVPAALDTLRRRLLEPEPKNRLGSAIEGLELLRTWSGYRNETLALARLCRLCFGVTAPRSGVEEDSSENAAPLPIFGSESIDVKSFNVPGAQRRRWWPAALLGAGGLALVVGVGALAFENKEDVAMERAPEDSGHHESVDEPSPVREGRDEVDRRPAPSPEIPQESADLPALAGGDASLEIDEPSAQGKSAVPARVRFRAGGAGGFLYVYVRIRGAGGTWQLLLEPVKTIDLPPGRFRISYRVELSEPWVEAGQITIQSGREYEVTMSKSGVDLAPKG